MLLAFAVSYGMKKSILAAFAALLCASAAGQNNYKVIHSFSGFPNDGMTTIQPVVFDKAGNMYGTTPGGGNQTGCGDFGCGVAYELSPDGQGNWTETVLYNFCSNYNGVCLDGAYPNGLTIDTDGNLYGTTFSGGSGYAYLSGPGVAFELSPPKEKGGAWTETVLYNFCSDFSNGSCQDGWVGEAGALVLDKAGNLYGSAALGGTGHVVGGEGIVFELSRGAEGWQETVLHNFCTQGEGDECPDGYNPGGGESFDKYGNLYGTTPYSGNINKLEGGTLFVLSRGLDKWKYTLLAVIPSGTEPSIPEAPVSFDDDGNLYGSLAAFYGGVFRIDAKSHRSRLFKFNGSDGAGPGGLYLDAKKNAVYAITAGGGANNRGTIFTIDAAGNENVLYSFCQQISCTDGDGPGGNLAPDAIGNFYGTAEFGGAYGLGVVFEFTP